MFIEGGTHHVEDGATRGAEGSTEDLCCRRRLVVGLGVERWGQNQRRLANRLGRRANTIGRRPRTAAVRRFEDETLRDAYAEFDESLVAAPHRERETGAE